MRSRCNVETAAALLLLGCTDHGTNLAHTTPTSDAAFANEASGGCHCSHSSVPRISASGGSREGIRTVLGPHGSTLRGVLRPCRALIPTVPECSCSGGIHAKGQACQHMCECGAPWNEREPHPVGNGKLRLFAECEEREMQSHILRCYNSNCNRILKYDGFDDGIFVVNENFAFAEATLQMCEVLRFQGVTIAGIAAVLSETYRGHTAVESSNDFTAAVSSALAAHSPVAVPAPLPTVIAQEAAIRAAERPGADIAPATRTVAAATNLAAVTGLASPSSAEQLADDLSRRGLRRLIILGNGDCLFSSMACGLNQQIDSDLPKRTQLEMRCTLRDHLLSPGLAEADPCLLAKIQNSIDEKAIAVGVDASSLAAYAKSVMIPEYWGSYLDAVLLADALSVRVTLYESAPPSCKIDFVQGSMDDSTRPIEIMLLHIGNHFDLLVPLHGSVDEVAEAEDAAYAAGVQPSQQQSFVAQAPRTLQAGLDAGMASLISDTAPFAAALGRVIVVADPVIHVVAPDPGAACPTQVAAGPSRVAAGPFPVVAASPSVVAAPPTYLQLPNPSPLALVADQGVPFAAPVLRPISSAQPVQSWLVSNALTAFADVAAVEDRCMVCPHCRDNPQTLVPDGISAGVAARHGKKFAPDLRPRCRWELATVEPKDFYFLSGITGMREFSKLLYRFVRPPGLHGKPAPQAPVNESPLKRPELSALIAWLRKSGSASRTVTLRMSSLADVIEYLRDHVQETVVEGDRYRCPERWAHLLYPVCMPSAIWVIHQPAEQAALLRALLVTGALDPTPAGDQLRKSVEQIAPWVVDFFDANAMTSFPSVSIFSGMVSV